MSSGIQVALTFTRELRRLPGMRRLFERTDAGRRARRLVRSGLIDTRLYATQLDLESISAEDAAAHYVSWGHAGGLTINALIDDSTLRRAMPSSDRPPIFDYLWTKSWRSPVSPFWDVDAYVAAHPEALNHASGPVGHLWDRARSDSDTLLPGGQGDAARQPTVQDHARAVDDAVKEWARTDALRRARRLSRRFHGVKTLGRWDPAEASPLVSVVLATWNRSGAMREAIESVLAQTWRNWEVIVVDDGSWDDTPTIGHLLAARDSRITYVQREHAGVSAARNAGIERARGDFVTFLDSDNVWSPEFVENMMIGMRARRSDVAYATLRVDGDGEQWFREVDATRPALELGNVVDLNTLVVSRAALERVSGFDTSLPRAVDYDLILRLSAHYPLHHIPVLGALYDNTSEAADRISTSQPLGWNDAVRLNHLIDWTEVAQTERSPGASIAVLIARDDPTIDEKLAGARQLAADEAITVEIALLDPSPSDWIRARATAAVAPRVRTHFFPGSESFAYVTDMLLAVSEREVFVVVEPTVHMDAAAVSELARRVDPVQRRMLAPLILHPDGTIVAVGSAFPKSAAATVDLLARHPVEDALALGPDIEVPALAARTFAAPARDLIAVRGLDPLLHNEYELPAVVLRLRARLDDYLTVTTTAVRLRRMTVATISARQTDQGA